MCKKGGVPASTSGTWGVTERPGRVTGARSLVQGQPCRGHVAGLLCLALLPSLALPFLAVGQSLWIWSRGDLTSPASSVCQLLSFHCAAERLLGAQLAPICLCKALCSFWNQVPSLQRLTVVNLPTRFLGASKGGGGDGGTAGGNPGGRASLSWAEGKQEP